MAVTLIDLIKRLKGSGTDSTKYAKSDGAGGWVMTDPIAFNKINQVYLTASGTYTTPAGVRALIVECVGGGGGCGGSKATAGTCCGSPGAAGGTYARKLITSPAASYVVTIGAAGAAGAATPTNGGDGGATSFGSACIASGGKGSVADTSAGSSIGYISNVTLSDITGSVGDIILAGEWGDGCYRQSASTGKGGDGGASGRYWGAKRLGGIFGAAGSGGGGSTYGGGASGSNSVSATGQAGITGGIGICIVTEIY